jgi:arylsulfatase A-like enzyme
MTSRREFLAGSAATLAAAPARKPNIVYIMADDLGRGDVGPYGQDQIRTPNVDRLAAEGMRFTDAYSGCTVCAPCRSVLMTGLHMGHTPIRSNGGGTPIFPGETTVADVLKGAGYSTGMFGKWGLGDIDTEGVPWKHGFDEFFGYLHQVHAHWYYPKYLFHNDRKVMLDGAYSHDAIAEKALDFIRRNKANPFLCYVPFTIPHWELLVPEDSLAEYRGKFPEDDKLNDPRGHYGFQKHPHAAYAAMITRLDRDVGRIVSLIRELALERDTLIVFTSDNGGASRIRNDDFFRSYGPFRGFKQNLYEGGIRVPFIARWPGRIKPGAVTSQPWMHVDFMATAAELAGASAPKKTDSLSILPTLFGDNRRQKRHEYLYWELPRHNAKEGTFLKEAPMQALRQGDWKAVRPKPNAPVELYNLKDDIGETRDLAAANPQVLARLEQLLKTARVEPRPQKEPPHDYRPGA